MSGEIFSTQKRVSAKALRSEHADVFKGEQGHVVGQRIGLFQ